MESATARHPSETPARSAPPLLVFADDWGRHPSSCQHLTRCLLPGHRVLWVNTIGMRTPRLNVSTLKRGFEKLLHWSRRSANGSAAVLPENLQVVNPRMWPWFTSSRDRRLNRHLLLRALNPLVTALPEPPVAITTLPIVADLMGSLPVRRWVYYCVDDFSQWPGLDQRTLGQLEETVVREAEVLIAVSETLRSRLDRMGRASHLLTHGFDPAHWRSFADALPQADRLPRPFVLYFGVVDRRMDTSLVRRLAQDMTDGTILLLGPNDNPDPELMKLPRVVSWPPLPYEQLPAITHAADVLVAPYADLPVTRAMQPLKLKEYMATGRPVVARRLPSTQEWGDCLDLADNAEEFSTLVRRRLAEGVSREQSAARQRLDRETWDAKARLFARWALLDGDTDSRRTE